MSATARLAMFFCLAIHLASASAPCPIAKLPDPELSQALASERAHPCPAHAAEPGAAEASFDALCPCGCETGAPPGGGASRSGPALLLADLVLPAAPEPVPSGSGLATLVRVALAPPDHVPLPIA